MKTEYFDCLIYARSVNLECWSARTFSVRTALAMLAEETNAKIPFWYVEEAETYFEANDPRVQVKRQKNLVQFTFSPEAERDRAQYNFMV